ncbi:MAG TPA: efflux RND transporter periplasmic adaptor subunit [Candidatus Methylomirabilis sp.]|nr:efflux RND transporter periplasmic adaptor subunit [Candidatus Methylomirabilis sp.]
MKHKIFSRRNIIIFIIVVAVILAGWGVIASRQKNKTTYVTDTAQQKDLLQTVSEVGTVDSPSQIDLNFSSPGKLAAKFVGVGDRIKIGDILAQLDIQTLTIQRNQAAASLSGAQASLAKLLQGATAAQLAVAQAQVDQANAALTAATDNLNKTKLTVAEDISQAQENLQDLQGSTATTTTYEQAAISARKNLFADIRGKLSSAPAALDSINVIITDDSIKDFLSANNKIYLSLTQSDYDLAQSLLVAAKKSLAAANDQSTTDGEQAAGDTLNCLRKISDALNDMYNALINSEFSNQTLLNTDKTNISAQITANNAAISVVSADQQSLIGAQTAWDNAVNNAKDALASANINGNQKVSAAQNGVDTANQGLAVAQKQLAQLKAPPRAEDINLAQSQVNNAQAALQLVNQQIDNDTIKSPIDGQVVKDNYSVGEQTNLSLPVFSVLAENNLEIDVDISESDIAKVKPDDEVEITLDAFGPDQKFAGTVYFIEPAATVIQDVTFYKVKIKFTDPPEKLASIKPGMTANVTIMTAKKSGVIAVTERAIIEKSNGDKIVRVLRDNKIVEEPVTTGLRGDDGSIEIVSGNVQSGDTIVVLINTK